MASKNIYNSFLIEAPEKDPAICLEFQNFITQHSSLALSTSLLICRDLYSTSYISITLNRFFFQSKYHFNIWVIKLTQSHQTGKLFQATSSNSNADNSRRRINMLQSNFKLTLMTKAWLRFISNLRGNVYQSLFFPKPHKGMSFLHRYNPFFY